MSGKPGRFAWLSDAYAVPAETLCLKPGKAGLCCRPAGHDGGHAWRKGVSVKSFGHRPGEGSR